MLLITIMERDGSANRLLRRAHVFSEAELSVSSAAECGSGSKERWTPAEKGCAFPLTRTGSMPKKGSEAEPGFWAHTPGEIDNSGFQNIQAALCFL